MTCPVCKGEDVLRTDVYTSEDRETKSIPEDAEDYCIQMHGFNTSTPVGGVLIHWHGEEVEIE